MVSQFPILEPDRLAAHDFLSELRTRIATQPLPYQYGVETRALESLREIFDHARKAMKDHPGCAEFARISTNMLNVDLRPVTAKWHRAAKAGILDSKDGANEFRADLDGVRSKLVSFAERLQVMAYGQVVSDDVTPDVLSANELARCFRPVRFGIAGSEPKASNINASEGTEIARRRERAGISKAAGDDAVGLALSGGGIRSATFCLGVVQVLAERGLMKHVDYLSTVSGGGYTGSFITSRVGNSADFRDVASPYGPDTSAVRHGRQNAKYLSAVDLKHRWLIVSATIAGLMLNWTAPLFILGLAALLYGSVTSHVAPGIWLAIAQILGMVSLVLVFVYGLFLKLGGEARRWSIMLSVSAGLTLSFLALSALEWGYLRFSEIIDVPWSVSGSTAALIVAAPAMVRFLPIFANPAMRKLMLKVALLAAGLVVPLIAIAIFYLLRRLGTLPWDASASFWSPLHWMSGGAVLLLLTTIAGLFSILLLDVNLSGPHKLYRDQLAATFVRATDKDADIPLTEMNRSETAPYHLLNATVNLPSSISPVLRDRKGDFFVFSKHWTGSKAVGYAPTADWKMRSGAADLASAMAISGAAASSHMGLGSVPTLSALLTLLNIRLGFWIANPAAKPWGTPGFLCLLREMTGLGMSEQSGWLNLSDGGHIENMGIYELLRRRCKFIVCVDGEADPESTFQGQMTLVRHAQIDMGIRIEPRLDEIRPDPKSRYSRTHAHLFRVYYPAEGDRGSDIGLMLYVKLSLTGDEAELLKRYRLLYPEFPHQSTLDQFYDEEQFEAYRQLGVHVAEGLFAPAIVSPASPPRDIEDWFRQLTRQLLEPSKV